MRWTAGQGCQGRAGAGRLGGKGRGADPAGVWATGQGRGGEPGGLGGQAGEDRVGRHGRPGGRARGRPRRPGRAGQAGRAGLGRREWGRAGPCMWDIWPEWRSVGRCAGEVGLHKMACEVSMWG